MIHSIWQQLLLIEFEKNQRRSAQFVYCKSNRNNLELRSGDHFSLRFCGKVEMSSGLNPNFSKTSAA